MLFYNEVGNSDMHIHLIMNWFLSMAAMAAMAALTVEPAYASSRWRPYQSST